MKNITGFIWAVLFACLICASCTKSDDYKKYLKGGEIVYPQKADSVKYFAGKNRGLLQWVLTDKKVSSYKIVYRQSNQVGELIVPVTRPSGTSKDDTIRIIVKDLDEADYEFTITTYDKLGHESLSVKADGSVYGETYQKSLLNRDLKSKVLDESGLHLKWSDAEPSEVRVELVYTDNTGNEKTVTFDNATTSNTIADIDINRPFFYRTLHLPEPTAIDSIYALPKADKITFSSTLSNQEAPFALTSMGLWLNNRAGTPVNWVINAAAMANGNVDNNYGRALVLWSWTGYTPVADVVNAKIYQTLSLPAGSYSFETTVQHTSAGNLNIYVAANIGYLIPDINLVESDALSWTKMDGIANGTILKCNFTLDSPSIVSLGFVGSYRDSEVHISKVELLKL